MDFYDIRLVFPLFEDKISLIVLQKFLPLGNKQKNFDL